MWKAGIGQYFVFRTNQWCDVQNNGYTYPGNAFFDPWNQAMTFGYMPEAVSSAVDGSGVNIQSVQGPAWKGGPATNSDGLLCYPGMDLTNPSTTAAPGVVASLPSVRMKQMYRGQQDADILALATAKGGAAATAATTAGNAVIRLALQQRANYNDPDEFYEDWTIAETQRRTLLALLG